MRPVLRATPELSGIRTMHTGLQRPPARLPAPGQFHPQQRIGFPFRIPLATPGLAESHPAVKAGGLPVLADDSGLMVDALDGAPGVYSARYGHKNSDAERIEYLLSNLKDVPAEQRTAKFVCVITCLWPDGRKIVARGECPGQILLAPQGQGGFGYDPVFYLPELQKTYAELRPEEKNAISHRARALQAFCRIYREEFEHDDK